MALNCKITTTHDLCMELKPYFADLHPLPYNRFNRENTVWWFSPASEIPAYRFPKFAIMPPEAEAPDQLFIGIYIEKGVGEEYAKTVGYAKTHTLGANWAWHTLLEDMKHNNKLSRSIAEVRNATGVDLELRLYASMQIKDAADNLAPKGEKLVFDVADGLIARQPVNTKLLSSLAGCTSLVELASGLTSLEKSGFIWIDLVLGVPFNMKGDGNECGVEDIAKKVMAPFEWLVCP